MFDTILVPTDGSEHAVRAGEHGRYLARTFDATVHVVNVVDATGKAGLVEALGDEGGADEVQQPRGRQAVEAIADRLDGVDAIQTAVLEGEPTESILEYAADHDVDLVAMGTHGRTGIDRYVWGSVTERVMRRADAPVLTVRATDRSRVAEGYEEVLVPTDGGEAAAAAVGPALAIAERVDARVHAVNVVDVAGVSVTPEFAPPTEVIAKLESEGEAATGSIASQARDRGLDAVTEVREGFPTSELLAYGAENDVDLIAMGTAGRTGVARYLVGSTTERVVRHADVPVLAVNARERANG